MAKKSLIRFSYGSIFKFIVILVFSQVVAPVQTTFAIQNKNSQSVRIDIQNKNNADDIAQRKCWIGCDIRPVSPIIRSQMNLEYGLAVLEIAQNSPAAKAGLKPFDIILKLNRNKLVSGEQLSEVVDLCGPELVSMDIMREGKSVRLQIRPETRPSCKKHSLVIVGDSQGNFDLQEARKEVQNLLENSSPDENHEFEFILISPAVVSSIQNPVRSIPVDSNDSNRLVSSPVYKYWQNDDAVGIEIMRLESDLQQQLESIGKFQKNFSSESRKLERMSSSILRDQELTKRDVAAKLSELSRIHDVDRLTEIRHESNQLEKQLLKWTMILDEMEGFRRGIVKQREKPRCRSCIPLSFDKQNEK